MGLLDGSIAGLFSSVLSGIYLDATLYRHADSDDDGAGGGPDRGFASGQPVKAQLDKTIQRTVDGNADTFQSIFMLQVYDGTPVAKPSADDEITVGGTRWMIALVETDPANSYFLLGGRKSPRAAL